MVAELVTGILDTTLAVVFTWLGWKTGKILWKYTPYSYPNARINAMEAKLLSEQRLGELAESRSLEDFVVGLEDTYYREYLPTSPSHFKEIEIALEKSLEATYLLLESMLPRRVSGFFSLLREEWDVRNLSSVVKAHFRNEPAVSYVLPIGSKYTLVKNIAEAKSKEEVLALLEGTEYAEVYQKLLLNEIDLREFETQLYSMFYSKLQKFAETKRGEEKLILKEYVDMKIDFLNLLTIARGKVEGIEGRVLRKFIIPGGTIKYDILLSVEGIEAFFAELDSSRYREVAKRARSENGVNLVSFERYLRDYHLKRMEELSRFYPLSVATPLRYVLKREREIRKLKAIAKLLADGVSPEKIKELVGEVS